MYNDGITNNNNNNNNTNENKNNSVVSKVKNIKYIFCCLGTLLLIFAFYL